MSPAVRWATRAQVADLTTRARDAGWPTLRLAQGVRLLGGVAAWEAFLRAPYADDVALVSAALAAGRSPRPEIDPGIVDDAPAPTTPSRMVAKREPTPRPAPARRGRKAKA